VLIVAVDTHLTTSSSVGRTVGSCRGRGLCSWLYICSMVDGDVFVCLREVVPFNVIVVTLRECCSPQAKLSVDLDLTCSS